MKYRKLGGTDLEVSLIGLGTMTYGQQNTLEEACEQMDFAVSQGISFFDAAEMYPVPPMAETTGRTESYIGEWLNQSGKRDQVVLATKITGRASSRSDWAHIRGGPRLSREHIRQAIDGSLTRLKTDYVDLYQLHWPERASNYFGQRGYHHMPERDGIPIEETLLALAELVDEGLVRYIGISNETPWGVMEFVRLAEQYDLPKIVSIQNPYSLLNRQFEAGLAEMAIREKVGLLAYSPLAFGVLSGKYRGNQLPKGSRLQLFDRFSRYNSPKAAEAVERYAAIAENHGLSPSQMCLSYVCEQPFVTSCLIGATTMEQLRENVASIELTLPQEVMDEIAAVHAEIPDPSV